MWFPIVATISFGLVLIAYGQVLPKYNQHFGSPNMPLVLEGKPSPEGSLWLSISRNGESMIATTDDRRVIQWKSGATRTEDLEDLRIFLEERIHKLMFTAVLSKRIFLAQTLVVLAVDKSLVFSDVRPIVYLLGQLGFSRYAFEAKKPNT